MEYLRFAFDVGTASIGWAVLKMTEGGNPSDIVDLGVRIFDEPRNPKTMQSNAVARRTARSLRRQTRRRAARRRTLLADLARFGFLTEELLVSPPFGFSGRPYELRAKALDQLLTPREFAEVAYHLGQRRGFKSNRKDAGREKDSETKKEEAALSGFEGTFKTSGKRTIGEYFAYQIASDPHIRVRNNRTLRKMYEEEFGAIVKKQMELGLSGLTSEIVDRLKFVIFYQRPYRLPEDRLKSRIGKCELEPDELRTHRWDPLFQEFRIEKILSDLRLIDPTSGKGRTFEKAEKDIVRAILHGREKVTFKAIRRALKLRDSERFNFEDRHCEDIKGNSLLPKLKNHLLKNEVWDSLSSEERYEFIASLAECEDEDQVKGWIMKYRSRLKDDVSDDDLLTSAMKLALPDGTVQYSRKAISKLMPYMSQGISEYEARLKAYASNVTQVKLDLLLLPPDYRNPTVNRAMCQFRRVVNALIKKYGRPGSISIEYAREFGKSQRQISEIRSEQEKRRKNNDALKNQLIEEGGRGTDEELIKLKLWTEQGGVCPYTGETISKTNLFRDGAVEVDHIRPFSRSLDDSLYNLVVCLAKANQEKGSRTPGEWLGQDSKRYEMMIERITKFQMKHGKKKRFYIDDKASPETFIERQLNDTRYIARAMREYVQPLFDPSQRKKTVIISRGGMTGWLRHHWGLPKKDRQRHLHHAVDAIVIGCTTPKILKNFGEMNRGWRSHFQIDQPFPGFREKVEGLLSKVIVSHQKTQKLSGALHEEMSYSPGKESENGMILSAKRVTVDQLTRPQIEKIRDPAIKNIILDALTTRNWDTTEPHFKKLLKEGVFSGLKMKSGVPIKKVRVNEKIGKSSVRPIYDDKGRIFRLVQTGTNYALVLKKGSSKVEKISLWDAIEKIKLGKQELRGDMVLRQGDIFKIATQIYRVKKLSLTASSGPDVAFVRHDVGDTSGIKCNDESGFYLRRQSAQQILNEAKPLNLSVLGLISDESTDSSN